MPRSGQVTGLRVVVGFAVVVVFTVVVGFAVVVVGGDGVGGCMIQASALSNNRKGKIIM